MSRELKAFLRKLDAIPAAPHFVRYNYPDFDKSKKAYTSFAKGMPTVSYQKALVLVSDVVLGITDVEQAKRAMRLVPDSPSRGPCIEFLDAFCDYAQDRDYKATPAYSDFSTRFWIGRELPVPVRPTLVAREDGQLKPIFIFGWKSVPLDRFQRRLLMSIFEDAIFSLTDFIDSDAEVVFLPELAGKRTPEVWHRGDYELLSASDLKEQMEMFLSVREQANPELSAWFASKFGKPATLEKADEDSRQIRLDLRDR